MPAAEPADEAQQPQQPQPAASLVTTTRRGCAYDLWQLGRYRVVVRAHEAAVLRDPARPPLLARAKLEYMPKFSLEAVRNPRFRVHGPWNHNDIVMERMPKFPLEAVRRPCGKPAHEAAQHICIGCCATWRYSWHATMHC